MMVSNYVASLMVMHNECGEALEGQEQPNRPPLVWLLVASSWAEELVNCCAILRVLLLPLYWCWFNILVFLVVCAGSVTQCVEEKGQSIKGFLAEKLTLTTGEANHIYLLQPSTAFA